MATLLYITRQGWLVLLFSIASMTGGLASGSWLLYFTGLLGLLATIYSYNVTLRIDSALQRLHIRRRSHYMRGYDGAELRIEFIVENNSDMDLLLSIQDYPPERVASRLEDALVTLPSHGGSRSEAWYVTRPRVGSYEWSQVEVSSVGPLSLFTSAIQLSLPVRLQIAPAPGPGGYSIRHLPLGSGVSMKTPSRAGLEFLSLREYVEGDDPRMIHWPSTARLQALVVRENAAESRLRLAILLDYSLEMWFGTPGKAPIDHAVRLVTSLGGEALAGGGKLVLALFDGSKCGIVELVGGSVHVMAARLSRIRGSNVRLQDRLVECISSLSAHAPGSIFVATTGPGLEWESLRGVWESFISPHPVKVVAVALPMGDRVEERLVRAYEARILDETSQALYPHISLVYGGFEDLARGVLEVVKVWTRSG